MSNGSNSAGFDSRQLCLWLATLSPGDLSVNEAAAARLGGTMTTAAGSANDALWSQMLRAGWTQQITTDALSIPAVSTAYMLTETGARAVTKALAELVSWNSHILEAFNRFDLQSTPEYVRRLCSLFGRLTVRAAAQLAIAKAAKPATEDAQARQRDRILALDEISKDVLTAGQYILNPSRLAPKVMLDAIAWSG